MYSLLPTLSTHFSQPFLLIFSPPISTHFSQPLTAVAALRLLRKWAAAMLRVSGVGAKCRVTASPRKYLSGEQKNISFFDILKEKKSNFSTFRKKKKSHFSTFRKKKISNFSTFRKKKNLIFQHFGRKKI